MIYIHPETKSGAEKILPKGDRRKLPPGRGQVSLASLLWLLTLAAVVLAFCRWMEADLVTAILLLLGTIYLWWRIAERREPCTPGPEADQATLREEVRRWLESKNRNQ